jgi:uncharacterized protein YifN (PemK superfamily)
MPLPTYAPQPGAVLICDFSLGTVVGDEMVKKRPVIVVSRKEANNGRLCTVVPLSTTPTVPCPAWHYPMPHLRIPGFKPHPTVWAKTDLVATVSHVRLNKPYKRTHGHGRVYIDLRLDPADLVALRECLRRYLQLP